MDNNNPKLKWKKKLEQKIKISTPVIIIIFFLICFSVTYYHYACRINSEKQKLIKQIKIEKKEVNQCKKEKEELQSKLDMLTNRQYNLEKVLKFILLQNQSIYPALAKEIAKNVQVYEEKYKIPRYLMLLVIDVESSFRVFVKSKVGAVGLCQINVKVWDSELRKKNIIKNSRDYYDPSKNIEAGAYILSKYYKKYGSWRKALQAYFGKINGRAYYQKITASAGKLYFIFNSIN